MIDQDRDGIIGADDLAAIYNQIGERPAQYSAPCDRTCTAIQA